MPADMDVGSVVSLRAIRHPRSA